MTSTALSPDLASALVGLLKALTVTAEKAGQALDSLKGLIDNATEAVPKRGKGK